MKTIPRVFVHACPPTHLRSRGVSLVELMVGVVLGLLVTLAITSSFIGQRQTMRASQSLGQRVDGLRAAAELLARAVREHGYDPCFTSDKATSGALSIDGPGYSANRLTTFQYKPVTTSPPPSVSVTSVSANTMTFSGSHGLTTGDRVSICTTSPTAPSVSTKATVQSVSGPTVTLSQLPPELGSVPASAIQVAKRVDEVWEVRNNGRPTEECRKAACRSLYNGPTELVPDIDQLTVTTLPSQPAQLRITVTTLGVSGEQADRHVVIDVAMRNAGGI